MRPISDRATKACRRARQARWPNDRPRLDLPPDLATCIQAIVSQSEPAKLATLGTRAANPRLKRIM